MDSISRDILGSGKANFSRVDKKQQEINGKNNFISLLNASKGIASPLHNSKRQGGEGLKNENYSYDSIQYCSMSVANSRAPAESRETVTNIRFKGESPHRGGVHVRAELYEQGQLSIGKLSYIDGHQANIVINKSLHEVDANNVLLDSEHSIFVSTNVSCSGEIFPRDFALDSLAVKNYRQTGKEKLSLLAASSGLVTPQDLEKKKISIMKDSDSSVLVVRDYYTKSEDLFSHVKMLLDNVSLKIQNLIVNGKMVK